MSLSGNIFPETPSRAQQSVAADVCATLAQSPPKLPKSQQEEERTTKMQNNEHLKCAPSFDSVDVLVFSSPSTKYIRTSVTSCN